MAPHPYPGYSEEGPEYLAVRLSWASSLRDRGADQPVEVAGRVVVGWMSSRILETNVALAASVAPKGVCIRVMVTGVLSDVRRSLMPHLGERIGFAGVGFVAWALERRSSNP